MSLVRPALYLASRSPRRAAMLRTLGVDFALLDVEIDETPRDRESPATYVTRLAREKAAAAVASAQGRPVLAADTTVVSETEIVGKPRDESDAMRILLTLSGRWHRVLTSVALAAKTGTTILCVETRVLFRTLSPELITRYWASGEPADKAGAYAIQGLGGAFVLRLEGSYSNVVGLPLAETAALLEAMGIAYRLSASQVP